MDAAYFALPLRMRERIHSEPDRLQSLLEYHLLPGLQLLNQSTAFALLPTQQQEQPVYFTNITLLDSSAGQTNSIRVTSSSRTNPSTIGVGGLPLSSFGYIVADQRSPWNTATITSGQDTNYGKLQSLASNQSLQIANRMLAKLDHINSNPQHFSLSGALVTGAKLLPLPLLNASAAMNESSRYLLVVQVDRVLYPPKSDIYELISNAPMLSTLTDLLNVSGLALELKSQFSPSSMWDQLQHSFTFFAPSNAAFDSLGSATLDQLRRSPETTRGSYSLFKCMFTTLLV